MFGAVFSQYKVCEHCHAVYTLLLSNSPNSLDNRYYDIFCSTARDCGDPGVPDNGQVSLSAGTTLGSTATYSCDLGHDLIGASVRECGTDGQWTNSVPICMSELILSRSPSYSDIHSLLNSSHRLWQSFTP